jgi:DNA polymerase bacteriophage-type
VVDTIEIDYEGYNEVDISLGLDLYTASPTAEPLMAAYSISSGPWQQWEAHKRKAPAEMVEALEDPEVLKWAFNAQFERVFSRRVMKIRTPIKGWRCTMVLASMLSFSGSLGEIGKNMGIAQDKQKMKIGKQLIDIFCMPQTATKNQPHRRRNWDTDPELWQTFLEYNVQDCVAEREMREKLIRYPIHEFEWEVYEADQAINDRGLPIDMEFVRGAIKLSAQRKQILTDEMRAICGLANPGSRSQLLPWLTDRGYYFRDLQKESVQKVLTVDREQFKKQHAEELAGLSEDDAEQFWLDGPDATITTDCRKVLALRQWQARMATAKYDALLNTSGADARARYLYQMGAAARTLRWGGRRVQTQNLVRTPKAYEKLVVLETANLLIRSGDYEALALFTKEVMEPLVGLVRSAIACEPGREFRIADLASIETAMIAWLTNCKPLLEVFRKGLDPYIDFGTYFFDMTYEAVQAERWRRTFCKPPMLGCGYRLGGGGLYNGKRTGLWGYAEGMGVDMSQADAVKGVRIYREKYPEVPDYWYALEKGVERTLKTKRPTVVGKLKFEYRKPFLMMWLPGWKRCVYYFKPKLEWTEIPTGRMIERPSRGVSEDGWPEGEMIEVDETYRKLSFSYMGKSQYTGQWMRIKSHGGRTIEQATQASAREVFAVGMVRCHKAGFMLVGHSHDELISEAPVNDTRHTKNRMIELMTKPIPGFEGLPLGAAGFESPFYRKD